jgi:hypothetical protein
MPAPPSALDRNVRDDGGRVSVASYVYLFNEMAALSRTTPSDAADNSQWESRLAELGASVGVRTLGIAALNDPHVKHRDLSTDDIVKFVATVMWRRWFDRPASRYASAEGGIHFVNDDEPAFLPLRPPESENSDFHYGSFVAGMVQGVLGACGFPATVSALYINPSPSAATQFLVQWDASVLERERRKRDAW